MRGYEKFKRKKRASHRRLPGARAGYCPLSGKRRSKPCSYEDGLKATAEEVARESVQVKVYPTDIMDQPSREKLLEDVKSDFGKIDLLINNAGIELVAAYASLAPDYIETMIQTNLIAPMLLTRMVLPDMLNRGSGHIVSMSSLGGKRGNPYDATYS
ncbi:MAG: SDR family NAD(P)-dependent oxidoreductase, partial [Deltaproteobacteria bacterium]|nr:SDR family NAD(P)-dependent oxidoreductase [Deltaproteobacteria bacterium]